MFYHAKGGWCSGTGRFVLEPGFVTPSSLTRVNLVWRCCRAGVDFHISMSQGRLFTFWRRRGEFWCREAPGRVSSYIMELGCGGGFQDIWSKYLGNSGFTEEILVGGRRGGLIKHLLELLRDSFNGIREKRQTVNYYSLICSSEELITQGTQMENIQSSIL